MKRYLLAALLAASVARGATIDAGIWMPFQSGWSAGQRNVLIDASTEKVGAIWQAPKAGDITGLCILLQTVTEEDGLTLSLQNVDSSGFPDGTQDQSCTVTFTDADDNTEQCCTLGAARTVTLGEVLSHVVQFTSWTDGNLNIGVAAAGGFLFAHNAYYVQDVTGSWAKSNAENPIVGLKYGSVYHETVQVVWYNGGFAQGFSVASNSTPDEYANKWTPTFDCRLYAVRTYVDTDADMDIVIYDSGGTAVETFNVNETARNSTSVGISTFILDNPPAITGGQTYYIAHKPTTTTAVGIYYYDTRSAAARDQLPHGKYLVSTSRVDAGSWTDDTDRLMAIIPMVDQVTATAGGGGAGAPIFGPSIITRADPPVPPRGMRVRESMVWDGSRFRPGYILEKAGIGDWAEADVVPAVFHGTAGR